MNKKKNDLKTESTRVVRTVKSTKYRNTPAKKTARVLKHSLSGMMKVLLSIFLVITITGCVVFTAATLYVIKLVDSEAMMDITTLDLNYTSVIYAKNAKGKYTELNRINNAENRIWVDIDKVPQSTVDAIVCAEDKRFYDHEGVDWSRTIASFANIFLKFYDERSGGSTITQQLIKNINGDFFDRSVKIKINEIITAMNLERHFTKRQILNAYINYISFGSNTNGVQAAAKLYFNKNVSKLTIVESAALAATIQSPENQNPWCEDRNKDRRNRYVLPQMLANGAITQEEFDKAIKTELKTTASGSSIKKDEDKTEKAKQNWYVDAVINDVIAALQEEYGYSAEFAKQKLYQGGYKVYTNVDMEMQNYLEKKFADLSTFYANTPKKAHEAAMVVMDYEGHVLALVGGTGTKQGERIFSRATQAMRSPGSTIKPLSIYAPAFDSNLINWSTIMQDSPATTIKEDGKTRGWPNNYNFTYQGNIAIIDAIRVSKNTIPVKLCQQMTPRVCFDFLEKSLGISTLVGTGGTNDVQLAPLSIASLTKGFILEETTAAYAIFGNNGFYYEPSTFSKVTDAKGNIIIDHSNRKGRQVIGSDTAYVMNKALWQVVNTQGASGTGAKLANNMPTIGKTGTSDDRKDLSFMGLTPYYVGGIWFGYDDNTPLGEDFYSQMVVWKNLMDDMHANLTPVEFDIDDSGVAELRYCTTSGLLASSGCPQTKVGYYKKSNLPPSCNLSHSSSKPKTEEKQKAPAEETPTTPAE